MLTSQDTTEKQLLYYLDCFYSEMCFGFWYTNVYNACLSAGGRMKSGRSVMKLSLTAVNAKRCVTEAAEAVTASLGSARLELVSRGMYTHQCTQCNDLLCSHCCYTLCCLIEKASGL